MDGIHDMGGMDGFGKVEPEPDEPVFHDAWEGRVAALQRAMAYAGAWQIDHARYAQERLAPLTYLAASYYQKWQLAMETNVLERGLAGAAELAAGHAQSPGKTLKRKLAPAEVPEKLTRGSFFRPPRAPARFAHGDRVRTRNIHPATHTRLPRYARDKLGTVERCHGCHAFPDFGRARSGRQSAMALHRGVRGPRLVGRRCRPLAHGIDRRLRALSGAGVVSSPGFVPATSLRKAVRPFSGWPDQVRP